ncbi:protein NLRC5-like isoform X2 [Hoplias malabaricus]
MSGEYRKTKASEMSLQEEHCQSQSCVSFKSDQSMPEPLNFKEEPVPKESFTERRSNSPPSSCVSFKSDQSMPEPLNFKGEPASQERNHTESESDISGDKLQKKFSIFEDLRKKIFVFITKELDQYKKLLRKESTNYYRDIKEEMWELQEGVLNMAVFFLKMMKQKDLAEELQDNLIGFQQRKLKLKLREKCHRVHEGIAKQGESNELNNIYTDLYITERLGNKEHEIRTVDKSANQTDDDTPIKISNMFEPRPEQDKPIRTVMTQGIAGIGKSVCLQKFILDWAEGKTCEDIKFIFPLPFRELNLNKGNQSLMDIIYFFSPETKGMTFKDRFKIMFIFDGLDECKLPLNFHENESLSNVSTSASLDVVLTNLIKGNLLPAALLWITTRQAAASKIPAEFIDRVTELRGFNDEQKEEYFRKRISDQTLADKIVDHIKKSRSLHIMCHIPVFCWISVTVLQKILEAPEGGETPKTLTEMYMYFLIFQTIQGNLKYSGKNTLDVPWDKEGILSLGKLAFQHLEKSSLIFYTEDLEECGINLSKISVYSGLCTQETVRFFGTVFSFVHLSIQEFLAALFAYTCLRNDDINVFESGSTSQENEKTKVIDLLKAAVDKALESEHGHLDLFLRFLLGLSLESNETLIRGLLKHRRDKTDSQKGIVDYIKSSFKNSLSPERSINLFFCLNELNDDSLVKEVQNHINSGSLSEAELSPAQWSALVFMLLTSKEKLEVFDLRKFIRSDECLYRLMPVVKDAMTALLCDCNLTERSCSNLCKTLSSDSCTLTLLDMSGNTLHGKGVQLLSAGLQSPKCKLETLRLSYCGVSEEGYTALASALKSNPSSNLVELDLRGNDPGETGVQLLTGLQMDQKCKLRTLRLLEYEAEEACMCFEHILGKNPLLQRELDLSERQTGDIKVNQLSGLLQDPHYRLEKFTLYKSGSIKPEDCTDLVSALNLNPSQLRELDLNKNKLDMSGLKELCRLLKNPLSKLEKLKLANSLMVESCADLTSALCRSPSHLRELDLSENTLGDSGLKQLCTFIKNPECKLQRLLLKKCSIRDTTALTSALTSNLSHLRELDLSENTLGDSGLKQLCTFIKNPERKLQKLLLQSSSITEGGCAALSKALCLNPSHLEELDLSDNRVGDSGVQQLCSLLTNQNFKPRAFRLRNCSVTEGGYTALASALKSNISSQLIELDLSGNDPGDKGLRALTDTLKGKTQKLRLLEDEAEEACRCLEHILGKKPLLQRKLNLSERQTGDIKVKQLSALLQDPHYRLEKFTLYKSGSIKPEDCTALVSALNLNPSQLRELDLNKNKLDMSGLKELCRLLKNPLSKLEKLKLQSSSITEGGCAALSKALCSNPSHLEELDLSNNIVGDSGVQQLCSLLTNQKFKLRALRLSYCSITEEGYTALASALKANPSSPMTELDLRGNYPDESGVRLLTDLQKDPTYHLKTLRLLKSSAGETFCVRLTETLKQNPLLMTKLDLSGKVKGDSEVNQLCALLEDSHCRTKILRLQSSSITEGGCAVLSKALCLNPSHLEELDLSNNIVGDSGVEQLCSLLTNHNFKLRALRLRNCSVREEGCTALASALKANPSSPMTELDLRGNYPGESGVRLLTDLQKDPTYHLKSLRLIKSSAGETFCVRLTETLKQNPLLMTKLDLSGKVKGDSEVNQLCALLEDSHCRTKILRLQNSSITEGGCAALSKALCSNPSHLEELDLSNNRVGDSGVQQLCSLLTNQNFKLRALRLQYCSVTEGGYTALASALKVNPSSQLIELDLRGNDPGDKGVKALTDTFKGKTKKLRLLDNEAEEACRCLKQILGSNPLLQRELDLSERQTGDIKVKQLSALLQDPHYRLEKFTLYKSDSIKPEDCTALVSALNLNPSQLRELDLNKNKLDMSGLKELCNLLKNPLSKLEKLKLQSISNTERGCAALSKALCSNPSHLEELDLSNNTVGDSGVQQLCLLLTNHNFKLKALRVRYCSVTEGGYTALASALKSNPSSQLIELDLRGNDPGDKGVKALTDTFNGKTKTLRLLDNEAEKACRRLEHILGSNPLLQKVLDLSERQTGGIKVKQLSALLQDPHYRLEKFTLYKSGRIKPEDCAALVSALNLNPSQLRELDLNKNKLDMSGLKQLCNLLKNPLSKLEKLNLANSLMVESCDDLTSALCRSPSHLRELDLSENTLGDSGLKQLCTFIKNPECKFQKLLLKKCSITDTTALTSALCTHPSHLRELDLSENILGDSGLKQLCTFIKNPECKFQKLLLKKCSITDTTALTSALTSNLSHLRELDLRENKLGESMYALSELLKTSGCRLK